MLLTPMALNGAEPLGAMGTDTPVAVLSTRPRLLFDYFTQMFAQVTNPPLDAIREELVIPFPVLDNDQLAKIIRMRPDPDLAGGTFRCETVRGLYRVDGGHEALAARLREVFVHVDRIIEAGVNFVVLSDRDSDGDLAPIPSLLLLSGVHQHLVRRNTRTRVSLLVEAGDVREVHHVALLIGYGAAAVNPYLAMETVEGLARDGSLGQIDPEAAVAHLIKALGKGVLKGMSKMGISTLASYRGAQTFEAVGLSTDLVERYFTGTTSRLGGVGLDVVAAESAARHADAYPVSGNPQAHRRLNVGGEYKWRRDGEEHLFDPETVFRLQHSTRTRQLDVFRQYTRRVYCRKTSSCRVRVECCSRKTVSGSKRCSSPSRRHLYSPPTFRRRCACGLPLTGYASACRAADSAATTSRPTPPSRLVVPVKYRCTRSVDRPTASNV